MLPLQNPNECAHLLDGRDWQRPRRVHDDAAWSRQPDHSAIRPMARLRLDRLLMKKGLLPIGLGAINDEIERSRALLAMPPGWDGEDAASYSREPWLRAAKYLRKQALSCWSSHGVVIPAPRIGPGPNGSIDIHWKTLSYELLVNIPADGEALATFYGDDFGKLSIKGTFDSASEILSDLALVSWLIRD